MELEDFKKHEVLKVMPRNTNSLQLHLRRDHGTHKTFNIAYCSKAIFDAASRLNIVKYTKK